MNAPGTQYKLIQGNQYGLDTIFPDTLDIDESAMSVWIPFASGERRDGVGDLLEVGGIDTSRHIRNRLVLWDHGKNVTLPCGVSTDPVTGAYTVEIDVINKEARGKAFFYQGKGKDELASMDASLRDTYEKTREFEHALFCEQLFDMIVKGFVRGGSIGYQTIRAMELPPDYATGTPKGQHLLQTLMLEYSAVVLPANQDTVRKMLCDNECCGKPLSPWLVKSLQPFAPEKKAFMAVPQKSMTQKAENDNPDQLGSLPENPIHAIRRKYQKKSTDDAGYEIRQRHDGQWEIIDLNTNYFVTVSGRAYWSTEEQAEEAAMRLHGRAGYSLKSGQKSLPNIRLKYRKAKNLRRRVKGSKAGASVLRIHGKNVDEVRKMAVAKGLKFHHLGESNNSVKVKLIGDDAAIDEVATMYGKPVKTKSKWKSLENSMAKEIKKKGKSQDSIAPTAPMSGTAEQEQQEEKVTMDTADETPEPLGAQVLRRVHEDHSILMEHYDEMLAQVEQPEVKAHLQEQLERMEEVLTKTEEVFGAIGEYEGLKGLEGAKEGDENKGDDESEEAGETEEEKEMDTNAVASDSEEDEEPTGDEVVEGMDTKALRQKYIKGLRRLYGKKSAFQQPGQPRQAMNQPRRASNSEQEAAYKKGYEAGKRGSSSNPYTRDDPDLQGAWDGGYSDGKAGRPPQVKSFIKGMKCVDCGKPNCSCGKSVKNVKVKDGDAMQQMEKVDNMEEVQHPGEKALQDHERGHLQEAAEFAKELSTEQNFNDEHRMKSFHYHKALDAVAQMGKADEFAEVQEGKDGSTLPGDVSLEQEQPAPQMGSRLAAGEASSFFKGLSTERAFGDEHRQKAYQHHEALVKALDVKEQMEEVDEAAEVNEPGEIGEKHLQELIAQAQKNLQSVQRMRQLVSRN